MIQLTKTTLSCSAFLLLATSPLALASGKSGSITKSSATVTELAYKDSSSTAPIVITDAKTAAKYLSGDELKKIQALDFKKFKVLVFAWQGSGGDKLSHMTSLCFSNNTRTKPAQISFLFKAGLTYDLVPHQEVFIIKNNMKWETLDADAPEKNKRANTEPIKSTTVIVTGKAYQDSSVKAPLEINEKEAAKAYFAEKDLKTIQALDFSKVKVLVIAWRGSGQDKLTYSVAESFPEQIQFHFQRGMTRDLRPHQHVFILRKNVKWNAAK